MMMPKQGTPSKAGAGDLMKVEGELNNHELEWL